MDTEYYHTLIEKGGKVLGYGNIITENDWQIMGNENNRAICPPEEKWIGYKIIPFPHPTFVRVPPNAAYRQRRLLEGNMFGIYARNTIAGQGRYWPEMTRTEMIDRAMKSESEAESLYKDLAASRAFCDDMIDLRKQNPNKTWRELLTCFAPYLSKRHPYHFQEATKMIDDKRMST